jgi:hypothetical protein
LPIVDSPLSSNPRVKIFALFVKTTAVILYQLAIAAAPSQFVLELILARSPG